MIEIEGLTKVFGAKVAVRDLTIRIPRGEFFAFLGPNGAGKTTTLRVAVGLLRPTAGRVRICGYDVGSEYLKAKEKIAYIPDQPFLYEKLTGYEFLKFVADMYGLTRDEFNRRLGSLSETFGTSDYLHELTETYSHGMKQRVVISAALLHRPEVIIVDEPLVGLDPPSARVVKGVLKAETKRGATVFASTHTVSMAEELADRIGIIVDGSLVACDTLPGLGSLSGTDGDLEDMFISLVKGH